jgi:hypothetical protein
MSDPELTQALAAFAADIRGFHQPPAQFSPSETAILDAVRRLDPAEPVDVRKAVPHLEAAQFNECVRRLKAAGRIAVDDSGMFTIPRR